ncbi:RNA polymerase sigma factor [Pseudoalteromonas porphyrae]|uniref:RNA polymerase subunit sigma-70 n=1 Tax=Pseudoalteromonas porphyrae TaxID=187330 RepID=A0A0N1ELP2_9GAMM|nr:RNA polymerase sigma factor [Pseudoalteromonas porphyrae]KPH64562.1 RNA polymerase subunit sigma-70 [Pseudoalteromonas porphyrae]
MIASLKSWFISQPNKDHLADYAKSGDNRHLTKLVALFGNDLYHYLVTQSNEQLAFDISQQTWLKVMEKRKYYQPQDNPKAWLFRLARNALIDEFRKQQRFVELEDNTVIVAPNSEQTFDYAAFNSALMQLSFVQREALSLQQEGFSLEDIQQITQSNHETVKTRLRYAKQNLKIIIGADNEQA